MSAADRERITELLEDETRSFRSIGRELGVSDWLVRKTAREHYGDPRPMRGPPSTPQDGSAVAGWLVLGGIAAFFALLVWARIRWMPPESWD